MTLPSKKIPIGIDNFRKLVNPESHFLYIDKTLMLKEFIDKGTQVSLIIRPRRWGKTLNMSMIQHFFSPTVDGQPTKGMFEHLKIASINEGAYLQQHQGKHPVLFISFKDAKQDNFEDFLEATKELISEICIQHLELATSDALIPQEHNSFKNLLNQTANTTELSNSLKKLSTLLYKHYKNTVFIIIDEYKCRIW